jgi:chemotaxis protein CheC
MPPRSPHERFRTEELHVIPRYTDLQLDALRELANIASGTAATALSQMLGREVGLNVPRALALPLPDAVDAAGAPDETVCGVVIPLGGDIEALVLLLIPLDSADTLCRLLGVEAGSEVGNSALSEIGNILGTSYLNALAAMTGLELVPCPPHLSTDLLGAIVASVLAATVGEADTALVMDSELDVAGAPCSMSFLLLPTAGGAVDLLTPLGLSETAA